MVDTEPTIIKNVHGFPSTYEGFKIVFNPALNLEGPVFVTKLNLLAEAPDRGSISTDSWDELKAMIDADNQGH